MRFPTLDQWLVWQETLHPKSIDLGLARVGKVFRALLPEAEIPFTITVGGTNGKGSCVAMLDAILRAQGYRVGTYTSPHLLRYNERMRIDGECVADALICEAFARIERVRGDTTLSFFEFGTLAALDLFSKADLDLQILEVGLGGRLDAVNLIDADAALIASIDIDHQDWLGDTRDAIGLEKGGIFRRDKPAVIGDPDPPQALLAYAKDSGIVLACQGREFGYEKSGAGWTWRGPDNCLQDLPFPYLKGEHQLLNAAAVLQLLHAIDDRRPVSEAAIRKGLASVRLAGRFQYIDGAVPVLLDVAHNPQAVRILAEHLSRQFPARRIHAVFAIMRDKDIVGVVNHIKRLIDRWYLAPLKMPRAAAESQLTELLRELGVHAVMGGFADASAAFAAARGNAQNGDLIVVFGSFFLVSEFLAQIA
jgi:dihydrofolate synthase/folylpolyglutamate synthase